jgi:hypothetical protein
VLKPRTDQRWLIVCALSRLASTHSCLSTNVTASPGWALTTVLSKILCRLYAAPRLLAWWELLCSGTLWQHARRRLDLGNGKCRVNYCDD